MIFDSRYSKCDIRQKKVVSAEKKNEHILYNESGCNVYQYHIDGGIVQTRTGERCDYIVEVDMIPKSKAYIIELKGSDLEKAISQVLTTMNVFKTQLSGYIQLPRIIMRKVPTHEIHGNRYREFKRKFPDAVVSCQSYTDKI